MTYILFTAFIAAIAYGLGEMDGWNRAKWHYRIGKDGK